jgi:hypothetical protein
MIEALQAPGVPALAPAGPAAETTPPRIRTATVAVGAVESTGVRTAAKLSARDRNEANQKQSAAPEPVSEKKPAAVQPPKTLEDGAPVEAQPSAETRTEREPAPEANLPPIEPPRSWTKEAKQRFRSLPRETQEYLRVREQERDREVRQSQNEAAEARKAVEAERQAAAHAKQQYEQALLPLLTAMEAANAGEFCDIKTNEDAEKLAKEDPLRYARYAARRQQLALIAQEARAAEARQRAEQAQQWNKYANKQDALFVERVPAFGNPESRAALQQAANGYLSDIGFSLGEMTALYNGCVLRDVRMQQVILDGARYRQARNAANTAVPTLGLSGQRPGLRQPRVDPRLVELGSPNQRLEETGSFDAASALRPAASRATNAGGR